MVIIAWLSYLARYLYIISIVIIPDTVVTRLHLPHSVYKDNIRNLFCYFEGNSDCIHLVDGEMRIRYIYESFLVWIIPSMY